MCTVYLQDYLRMEDDLDSEFTQLAEARSNPHLLDIGSHMNRSDHDTEVTHLMSGDKTADELTMTKSIDDLLMYWFLHCCGSYLL